MKICRLVVLGVLACGAPAFGDGAGERLPVGEFTATRFAQAPVIDGVAAPGEWDRAFTTEGLIAPFEHQLHETVTIMSLGFDQENLYFLFRCKRGNFEWKLWKLARQNDDYSFGDSSVEVWVSPPAMVPETYQNVINTYPAVLDMKMVPSRGYTAQGWKGGWKIGVKESATDYVIEASVPIKDFGVEQIRSGEVWRFILARTCQGAKPRAQASWSITQGFAEIPQHPPVHMMDDDAVLQLTGTHTLFTGRYALPVAVVAPLKTGAEVDVEVRFHKAKTFSPDDRVETKRVSVKAGEKQAVDFSGDVTEWTPADKSGIKRANVTVTGTKAGGGLVFRHSFPYEISGWTPQDPVKPEKAPGVQELALTAQYGPETDTVLLKADIFDLPRRTDVATAEALVLDAESGKVLASQPARPFKEWYSGAEIKLKGVDIPVFDFRSVAPQRAEAKVIADRNSEHKKNKEPLEPMPVIPVPAGKKVLAVMTVRDGAGGVIKSATNELSLLRYSAEWMNNAVGVSDKVLPPWTPVQAKGGEVGVWNRTLSLNGLGLAKQVVNGGAPQLAQAMRLVAVLDGKEIEVGAGEPKVKRLVEAEADLTGSAEAAGLAFTARTRVEFDGFVNVEWDVAPAGKAPAKVDKLFLEIVLPAEKATHFCTTAGGWAAVHDVLPDYWSSRITSSGMLVGDFVPYIWLTDSDYAFLWFADHDKGWNHDPAKALPTQELIRKDGKVILRVNFFEIPTEVAALRTLTWGWQTFPSRPLPPGWRATFCNSAPPVPSTRNTYFWFDADWAVLWPYYCSPFPWHMDKSLEAYSRVKDSRHRPCVGSIAHSIGRYRDYDGNEFPGLSVDWGATPGQIGNSDVTASKGPNDFRLWHYQRWVREGGFRGLYVDENYLALEDNFLTGNAYWRPDGLLQRAYNYIGLRQYFKRLKYMFAANGVPDPNLWQHISSGSAYHAWFGDIFYEGENVEPTDLTFDYIEVLPAGRLRAIGSSACAGGAMTMMCQSIRHRTQWWEKHTHQFLGWVMAHDVLPEQVPVYPHIAEAAHLWADKVTFLPYWKPGPFTVKQDGCLVSAHQADGRTLLWIVNTSRQDADVAVAIDWKAAGLNRADLAALDAETGEPVALTDKGLTLPVLQRDFVAVLLVPRQAEGASFTAGFDKGLAADYAVYSGLIEAGRGSAALSLVPDDKGGQALALTNGSASIRSFLHVGGDEGRVAFRVKLGEKRNGRLFKLGPLVVDMKTKEGQIILGVDGDVKQGIAAVSAAAPLPAAGWHDVALAWKDGKATLTVDGQPAAEVAVRPLGVSGREPLKMPAIEIGTRNLVIAVDDIRLFRKAG
jgi:hypothetical protein